MEYPKLALFIYLADYTRDTLVCKCGVTTQLDYHYCPLCRK